jgi:hypothetical protein
MNGCLRYQYCKIFLEFNFHTGIFVAVYIGEPTFNIPK